MILLNRGPVQSEKKANFNFSSRFAVLSISCFPPIAHFVGSSMMNEGWMKSVIGVLFVASRSRQLPQHSAGAAPSRYFRSALIFVFSRCCFTYQFPFDQLHKKPYCKSLYANSPLLRVCIQVICSNMGILMPSE